MLVREYESTAWQVVGVLAIAVVYLSFLTAMYYWDGITFAQVIENAATPDSSLIHPSHLLYNLAGYFCYHLFHLLGLKIRAVTVLQVVNSILGALAAGTMFLILRETLRSFYLSTCLTFLFAFSAVWWRFATDADAYIPSVFFMLVTFYLLLPGKNSRPWNVAALFLASILLHELAIFFGIVIIVGLIIQSQTKRARVRTVLTFVCVTTILTCLIYFSCFYWTTGRLSPTALFRWITYHSPDGNFSFDPVVNLKYTLRGHVRLFFGGRLNSLKGLMSPAIVALLVLLATVSLMFAYKGMQTLRRSEFNWRRRTHLSQNQRNVLILSFIWMLIYLVFLFFWIPQNTFYRLFYLPALILIVGLWFTNVDSGWRRNNALAFFTAALSLSNLLFLIFPYSHPEKYPPLHFALQMRHHWPKGTVIFYGVENADENLVRYFNPDSEWRRLDNAPPLLPDDTLHEIYARGSRAWLETTAIDYFASTVEGEKWLDSHMQRDTLSEVNDPAYRIRFVQITPATATTP